jgi:hypothetical protein
MGRQFQVGDRVFSVTEKRAGVVIGVPPIYESHPNHKFASHNLGLTAQGLSGPIPWSYQHNCEWIDHSGIARAFGRGATNG